MFIPNQKMDDRFEGKIVYWNDEKGYGFLRINNEAKDIFFHISSYLSEKRPHSGMHVTCLISKSNQKKQKMAYKIAILGDEKLLDKKDSGEQPEHYVGLIYCVFDIFFFAVISSFSLPLSMSYLLLSIITIMLYSYDKRAAITNKYRIPEMSLYFANLLGGWPGGLIARPWLRHKMTKNKFILIFWVTLSVNIILLTFILHLLSSHQ